MKFLRRYIKSACALCLIFALMCNFLPVTGTQATPFEDVLETDWHYPYVLLMTQKGILKGMTPTAFEPSGQLTRAQLCALMCRCAGLEDSAVYRRRLLISCRAPGADSWFSGYVSLLGEVGVVPITLENGVLSLSSEAVSYYNQPVTRAEAAGIISGALELAPGLIVGGGYDQSSLALYASSIPDLTDAPENLRDGIAKCFYNGILNGFDDGLFYPQRLLTRAEAAKIVAVITDYSLRERTELRDLPATALVTADSFVSDWSGGFRLKSDRLADVLWQLSLGLEFTPDSVNLNFDNIVPAGYRFDASVYVQNGSAYARTAGFEDTLYPASLSVPASGRRCVVVRLLNATASGRVDGVATFEADPSGKIILSEYDIR